jgi:hypothetical protein
VLYELNPRTFTSPNGIGDGGGSGTFASLRERLPYLAELGVNGIWMAGHSLATDHFYGVWSAYAADRPDVIDPHLGTPDDLRDLVAAAHALGIRLFLDVISHGVVSSSTLVTDNPDWFDGGTWGMVDYNYRHPAFRRWWIDLWVGYVRDFDIDGYRVDVSLIDPTIWDEITEQCALLGKPIAVFPENGRYHYGQQETHGPAVDPVLDWAIAREFTQYRFTVRQLSSHDRGWEALPGNHYVARGSRWKLGYGLLLNPQIPLFFAGEEFDADPQPLPTLTQGLYGSGGPGGWLYGCRLDWSQLEQPAKRDVLSDVMGYLAARREYRHLLNADIEAATMLRAPADGASSLVPYIRYIAGRDAILVVGNDLPREATFHIELPLEPLGFNDSDSMRVSDALDRTQWTCPGAELRDLLVTVGADYQVGGGVRALYFAPDNSGA